MNIHKLLYIAPTAETLEVKVEGVICGSTGEKVSNSSNWSGIDGWN